MPQFHHHNLLKECIGNQKWSLSTLTGIEEKTSLASRNEPGDAGLYNGV